MSNILSLKRTGDAVNDAKAIIDTVAREINKENTSYYNKRTNQKHKNIEITN